MVRVRLARSQKKRAHPARGPKWDRKRFKQCMRHKPHTNQRYPLGTRSPCYGRLLKPALPRHEGEYAVKVSMKCSCAGGLVFILRMAHGPSPLFGCVWCIHSSRAGDATRRDATLPLTSDHEVRVEPIAQKSIVRPERSPRAVLN